MIMFMVKKITTMSTHPITQGLRQADCFFVITVGKK
jgi:hypothetical protein